MGKKQTMTQDNNQHLKEAQGKDFDVQTAQTGNDVQISQTSETVIQDEKNSMSEFEPKIVVIRLRQAHPQDSYGRAGYRFTKTEEMQIPYADLSDEQVLALHDDPWLEVSFLA